MPNFLHVSHPNVAGYQHADYAEALSEFGAPYHLSACNGWILIREIADHPWRDARGCYPIFSCADWTALPRDLENIEGVISLVMVIDPFGNYAPDSLSVWFPDLCAAYKQHHIIDLTRPLLADLSEHHARNIRMAAQQVEVQLCDDPSRVANEWVDLYKTLIDRHRITGIAAFSDASLRKQLEVPGTTLFRATAQNQTVGMMLWYEQQNVGYYHLAAYSDVGYKLKASFAVMARSIEYFSTRAQFLSLGAGAGTYESAEGGLSRFKRGWATGTRTAYLCGRIFDRTRYDQLVAERGLTTGDFFPLYRTGEVS